MESAINLTEEDYNRIADIISNEIRCVQRADTNQCDRDCSKCDLVKPTQDIISVYDDVLEILNTLKGQKAHWIFDPDGMDWGLPAWRCSHCSSKNDMIPTYVHSKENKMIKVENPYVWSGSKFCPTCGYKMIKEKEERI